MSVSRVCYASREDVQRAPDFRTTAQGSRQIDRAIQSASDLIEAELRRVFYPRDTVYKFDWPNYQYAAPARLWFDQWDLISLTQVESPHGTVIPLANVIPRPVNRKPGWPFTYLELDRSATGAWTAGPTPQLAIWVTGTWGFCADADLAGTLAAAIVSTTATTITVSDGSAVGVGDIVIADTERMLVTEKAAVTTGQTNLSGATTASESDVAITVTSGAAINLGEVLLLDAERLLVTDVTGNVVTVVRQWDGTLLATHTAGTPLNATLPPTHPPATLRGLAGWWMAIPPYPPGSGLAAVSGVVTFAARIYEAKMLEKPEDNIDKRLLAHTAQLMNVLSGSFTLTGNARNIDLQGAAGQPLAAASGFIMHENTLFRVAQVTIPIIVNDLWQEVA